jgi:Phage integrase, N-terminal SAM-like domain
VATIEKRVRNGKTTYRARYRDPAGAQRSKVFARKADAQRFLNETETAKARGTWTDPALGRVLFRDWLGEWWATTTNLRASTRARDESLLRRLALPRFGDASLAAISQRDVRAWVADLSARGLAPATVQKAYQLLGKVMGAAVDAGMLAQSPCRRVPLPKVEREEMRFLTPAEVATLAEAIHQRYRALVLVGAYGGLRIGELAGLRRGRVDLLRGTVQVAEIVVEVQGVLHVGPPKTRASGARSGCLGSWSRSWPPTWPCRATWRAWCSPRRRVGRFGCQRSAPECGDQPSGQRGWTGCAFTTFGTRRWRCGSRPVPIPRRSRPGLGTPR